MTETVVTTKCDLCGAVINPAVAPHIFVFNGLMLTDDHYDAVDICDECNKALTATCVIRRNSVPE
jgi:hypothetical protein